MGGSSKKGGGGSSSYNYFGTIAGALCLGPVDEIYGIEVDDELKWSATPALARATSPNPVEIDVSDYGRIRFYWGAPDQLSTDALLFPENNTLGHRHPAYTGVCYALLVNFLFGQERTSAPTVRFYLRRAPRQAIVTGIPAHLTDGQANVIAIIAELLTSHAGLGWPADMLDAPSFQAAADTAQARHQLANVSLALTKQAAAKAAIIDLLAMVDGYVRPNRLTGRLEIGLWPPPETIDPAALPLLTEADLTERPKFKIETWDDIITRWRCTYNDREKNFKERGVKYDDARARHAAGNKRPETLRRNLITRHAQAVSHLQAHAHRRGTPGTEATLTVRAAGRETLQVGAHVRVDIDPEPGGLQRLQIFRLLEITRRETAGELRLKLEAERTLQPAEILPPDDPLGPPAPPAPVADIVYARIFAAPPALADGVQNRVIALASRPAGMVIGYRIYFDTDPADLFPRIGGTRSFALRGRLHAPLADSDTATTIAVEILDPLGQEIISENPGPVAAADDALLLLLVKPGVSVAPQTADADDAAAPAITPYLITPPPLVPVGDPTPEPPPAEDPAGLPWLEVCSCEEFTATAPGVLAVTALRGRRGTVPRQFAAGDEAWFIRRDQLAILEHADFDQLAATLDPAYFKLQPAEPARSRPLEDCAPRPFTFALTPYVQPEGTLGNLVLDPPLAAFAGTMQVRVAAAGWQEVHYTLDGAAVTVDSPWWPVEPLWDINQDAPRVPLVIDRSCRLRVRGWERRRMSNGRFTGLSTPEAEGYYTSGAATVPATAQAFSVGSILQGLRRSIRGSLSCPDAAATIHYRVLCLAPIGYQFTFKTADGDVIVTITLPPGASGTSTLLATGWYTLPAGFAGEAFSGRAISYLRLQSYATRPGYTDSIITDGYRKLGAAPDIPPGWPA